MQQLSLFIAALDTTIAATSVPAITSDLNSASGYFWIGGAFLLADAAAAPIWAKLSDIWGRKPALLGAVMVFAVGSILAATSVSMRMLIAARALQGTAAGGLIQLVNITISDLFSMRSRTLYFGLVEVTWALAGGLGPILGGAFTQLVSWRWCFWINLPVCGTTFVLLILFLDVHNPRTSIRSGLLAIDWYGTLSILAVTLMLLLGLDFGGATFPWSSPKVICLIVFGAVMIVVFIFSETRLAKYPLIPTSIFKSKSTRAALGVAFCQGMVFMGAEYYLPLYFQSVKSARPLRSGVLLLPDTISEASMGVLSAIVIHQTGRYREIMWIGTLLMTIGVGLYINFQTDTSVGEIVGFELLAGLGAGLLFQPPLVAVQAMVSQADTATATGTMGFVRNIATSLSVVLGGIVFQNGMDTRVPSLRAAGLNGTLIESFSHGNAAASVEIIKDIDNADERRAVKDAFAWSLRNMWIMYTCIAAIGLVMSAFIVHRDLSREHTETRTGIEEMTKREGIGGGD